MLIEPFYGGSHKAWVDGLIEHSAHHFQLLTLSDHHWKWRMHGGAISLAKKANGLEDVPDLILVSDMLDLAFEVTDTSRLGCQVILDGVLAELEHEIVVPLPSGVNNEWE